MLETKTAENKAFEQNRFVPGPLTATLLTEGTITLTLFKRLHEVCANSGKNRKRKEIKTRKTEIYIALP